MHETTAEKNHCAAKVLRGSRKLLAIYHKSKRVGDYGCNAHTEVVSA